MSFETILVECARENSINFNFDPSNSLKKENSKWTNNVNFRLKIGDQVSCENAIIHSIGNSESSTVEINGEQNENGFVDNQQGFQFMYYINNNGYNAIQLPYVGGWNKRSHMYQINQPIYDNNLNFLPMIPMTVYPSAITTDGVKTLPPRYNAPILTNDYNFVFTHKNFDDDGGGAVQISMEDNIFTNYKQIPNNLNPSGERNYDGCKYILLNKDFQGYYRSSNDDLGGDGEFDDDADDLLAYIQDVSFKVDVGFTTPSTLCNDITEALHATFENPDDEIDIINPDGNPVVSGYYQGKCYPIVKCNGNHDEGQSPCWSNIAVKDFQKARGVYNMMRTSIAFDGLFRFEDSDTEYGINRPAIHISGCVCRFKDYTGGIIETSMYPYKRIEYRVDGRLQTALPDEDPPTDNEIKDKESVSIYSLCPQGWLITTNMKYTEKNVERMIRYFEGNERYTGDFLDETEQNQDIENWYVRMDLGASRDGANSQEGRPNDLVFNTINPYVNKTAVWRSLSTGKVRLGGVTLSSNGFDEGNIYAGGMPVNPYSINSIVQGMKLGDDGTDYRFTTCPRSQTLRRGMKMYDEDGIISVESTTLDAHFYNNEFGDCNLTLYSKFRDDYKTFIKQSNTDKDESEWKEGDGGVKHKIDVEQIDTSFTTDYGIYGIPSSKYNINHDEYILCLDDKPLYLQAFADELTILNGDEIRKGNFAEYYRFLTKIQVATSGDQQTYGGYELLNWNDDIAKYEFEKNDDVFIYTTQNHNYKAGHDLSTMTYRDGKKIDFEANINLVVFYVTQTYTWVGEIVDDTDYPPYTAINLYPIDTMTFSTVGTRQEFLYYFYMNITTNNQNTVATVKGTNLYVVTDPEGNTTAPPLIPLLKDKSDGDEVPNNAYPFLATANAELCIGFILKNDSYTVDASGNKQVNNCKHILPSIYQSLFLCSPAFLDLPTVWLLNKISNNPSTEFLDDGNAQKYMSVGASDPTCSFDTSLQKATFSQLHTSRILGIQEMPYTDASENALDTDTLGSVVTKFYGKHYYYYNILDFINITTQSAGAGDTRYNINYETNSVTIDEPQYATTGIMINKIYGTSTDINKNLIEMTSEEDFNNSLLFKLGFLFEDFFNKFGSQDKLYDSSIVGKYDKANRYRNSKYYTTNPIIDISVEPFLSVYSGGGIAQMEGLPIYQQSYLPQDMPHTVDGGTSEEIIASNKPIKQTSSYYQIRSDLISTNYISNNEKVNTIALGMKEYTSNDFIYCNTNDYGLTVLQDQNISSITTEFRLSTGNLAPTNQLNTVIYKIRRPIILEDLQTIVENSQQMEKEYIKEMKQEEKQQNNN